MGTPIDIGSKIERRTRATAYVFCPSSISREDVFIMPRKRHGWSGTSEHNTWMTMKSRCYYPKNNSYQYYGARGVKVCSRWLESFENFLEDMGPKPSPAHSIDRIDVNGDYEPSNCRWTTQMVQASNKSNNHLISYKGMTMHLSEWARHLGIAPSSLERRINLLGMSLDQAMQGRMKKSPRVEYKGKIQSLRKWAKEYGISNTTLRRRLSNGWDLERALTTSPDGRGG